MEAMVDAAQQLTVPQAARWLGIPGPDVYGLIFSGALPGAPASDGAVYVTVAALEAYREQQHPGFTSH